MSLIWKLLRKHISVFELAVFFVANLIGLVVILAGVQIYSDAKPFLDDRKESIIGNDYVAISKEIERSGINADGVFTQEEIDELLKSEMVYNVGRFTAANFEVSARLEVNANTPSFSTIMFFEAVPNEFIDIDLNKWKVDIDKVVRNQAAVNNGYISKSDVTPIEIPIIIPRNYLNLYNFGFSRSQNLPQITEDLMKSMAIEINVSGEARDIDANGFSVRRKDNYVGYIVGFSDRLNTILVPMEFIEWANAYYSEDSATLSKQSNDIKHQPSRLILEVSNPSDPAFISLLAEKGYISENQPSESGKAMVILERSVTVVVAIGVLFCILSIIILTLSIYLLLQKNIDKLENLVLIGHTPMMVSMPYILMTLVLNVSIMVVSFVLVGIGRVQFLEPIFKDFLGAGVTSTMAPTYITGIILTVAIILFNVFIIYRKVNQISRKR